MRADIFHQRIFHALQIDARIIDVKSAAVQAEIFNRPIAHNPQQRQLIQRVLSSVQGKIFVQMKFRLPAAQFLQDFFCDDEFDDTEFVGINSFHVNNRRVRRNLLEAPIFYHEKFFQTTKIFFALIEGNRIIVEVKNFSVDLRRSRLKFRQDFQNFIAFLFGRVSFEIQKVQDRAQIAVEVFAKIFPLGDAGVFGKNFFNLLGRNFFGLVQNVTAGFRRFVLVATGAPRLLIERLNRFGQRRVNRVFDIFFVDAHAESRRANHQARKIFLHEVSLMIRFFFIFERAVKNFDAPL